MIIHSNLAEMKNKILPTCLQGNYRDSLGELNSTSYTVLWAERVYTVHLLILRNTSHTHCNLIPRLFSLSSLPRKARLGLVTWILGGDK